MKYLRSCTMIALALIAQQGLMAQSFKITGMVTGLPDSTWLYLRTGNPELKLDSCRVLAGSFTLSGQLPEKAMNVILHTAMYTNYVSFWMENTNVTIAVKAGAFKKAVVCGSPIGDEQALLRKAEEPNERLSDSLVKALDGTTDPEIRTTLKNRIQTLRAEQMQMETDYVKTHPNSWIATNLLNIYASTWGRETAATLYKGLSAEMKATRLGHEISDYIMLNKDVTMGGRYIDFEQANAKGRRVKLSEIKAKYVLLDFWASWCGPCREENPALVQTYRRFKTKGFAILGVSLDDNKTNWLKAIRDDKLNWENVSDLRGDKNRAALIYGINAIPNNYLINEQGIIVAKNLRGAELDKKLEELLP